MGRGSLIGPVVAAACSIKQGVRFRGINDSKKLSAKQRAHYFNLLKSDSRVRFATGLATLEEIEKLNIYYASILAMTRALDLLEERPACILVDGLKLDYQGIHSEKIIGGDGKSQMIAAASIIAKEVRDAMIVALARDFPEFHFDQNKGYATQHHLEVLARLGPTPIHRKGYKPVAQAFIEDEVHN